MIKLCRAAFYTRLLDLHRSNSFGDHTPLPIDAVPEGWLSKDVQNESSLLYTRQRDIHDVGIVLLKMLLGLDVVDRFPDPLTAIHSCKPQISCSLTTTDFLPQHQFRPSLPDKLLL